MAGRYDPETIVENALRSRQTGVRLERFTGSLEKLLRNVLARDRRLVAYLGGYEAQYQKQSLFSVGADFDITLQYQENLPQRLEDIHVVDESWDPAKLYAKSLPEELVLVGDDPEMVSRKLNDALPLLMSSNEGLHGWSYESCGIESLTRDSTIRVKFSYIKPLHELRQLQSKANFAAKTIWRDILKRANVPPFVKPFLAFSYLAQECVYDDAILEEVRRNPEGEVSDTLPHLAYAPLVEHRGICDGFAWAFKRLMDEARVECLCVHGYLKEDTSLGHMWNLVKLDGQYYHVDVTTSVKCDGVHIGWMMQPDNIMRATHIWDEKTTPPARGSRFGYDYVEDYLAEVGGEFLDDGANEKYMFPDDIVE